MPHSLWSCVLAVRQSCSSNSSDYVVSAVRGTQANTGSLPARIICDRRLKRSSRCSDGSEAACASARDGAFRSTTANRSLRSRQSVFWITTVRSLEVTFTADLVRQVADVAVL